MEQTTYLQFILHSIQHHIDLPINDIINNEFKKLKPFHKEMLLIQCYENHNIYYENILSEHIHNPDFNKLISILMKRSLQDTSFFKYILNKYPDVLITNNQENIVNFPIEFFPELFSRTPLSTSKMTLSLFKLFKEPKKNIDKINFILDNQKKGFLPYSPDMYYLMLFFNYMKKNSLQKRHVFSLESKTFIYKPAKMTEEFLFISKLISSKLENIFDFIKPHLIKNTYKGQSFENVIVNEEDFNFFINFASSSISKEKLQKILSNELDQKLPSSTKKNRKI